MEDQDYIKSGQADPGPGKAGNSLETNKLGVDPALGREETGWDAERRRYLESGSIELNLIKACDKDEEREFEERRASDPEVDEEAEKTERAYETLSMAFQFPPQPRVKFGLFDSLGFGNPFF